MSMKVITASIAAALCVAGCHGRIPAHLGATGGRFVPCPGTPNCVSSFEKDTEHGIGPIAFTGDPGAAMDRLAKVIESHGRTEIVTRTGPYLHAVYTSFLFRFRDDVEFLLDRDAGVIHVKSASRLGKSDLGVNRKRVERIRKDFAGK